MKFLAVPLLALCLAGCATTPSQAPTLPPAITDAITQIKEASKAACAYEPTVETVSNILSAVGVPYVGMVSQVASQICSVVSKFGARRGGMKMTVNGRVIAVRGRFVR